MMLVELDGQLDPDGDSTKKAVAASSDRFAKKCSDSICSLRLADEFPPACRLVPTGSCRAFLAGDTGLWKLRLRYALVPFPIDLIRPFS